MAIAAYNHAKFYYNLVDEAGDWSFLLHGFTSIRRSLGCNILFTLDSDDYIKLHIISA